jgi:hypothetical protein
MLRPQSSGYGVRAIAFGCNHCLNFLNSVWLPEKVATLLCFSSNWILFDSVGYVPQFFLLAPSSATYLLDLLNEFLVFSK